MITYIKSNLFLDRHEFIAHGCNAQGVMGAGVALEIKRRYPHAFADYLDFVKLHRKQCLGLVCVSSFPGTPTIFNCITQEFYGKDGRVYASLVAIRSCFERINSIVPAGSCVAIPKIGAGYGGLRWEDVEKVLKDTVTNFNLKVYEL